jgi:dTDP-4-dehydrorhamnose reductase
MRWAVIGDQGMFGAEMLDLLLERGENATGFNRSNLELDKALDELARLVGPQDVIVNAVAYTAVDKAESDAETPMLVNGDYAGKLAQVAKLLGAKFIHISTDYVFAGDANAPYATTDATNPQSIYGKSKLLGEELVAESGADYSILRTAWLYGKYGKCFPKTMANLLEGNGQVRVVADQIGQPTWTRDLAELVMQVASLKQMPRVVHAVSSGQASWADFAVEVANSLGMNGAEVVEGITTAEFPTPAKRPAWSVLDNSSALIEPIGDWRERWRIAAPEVLAAR